MTQNTKVIESLKKGLESAQDTIKDYEEFLSTLKQGALSKATFLRFQDVPGIGKPQVIAYTDGGVVAVPALVNSLQFHRNVEPGMTVWLSSNPVAAVAVTAAEPEIESRVVSIEDDQVYISTSGEASRLVLVPSSLRKKLSVGDTVLLDLYETVILAKTSRRQAFTTSADVVHWSDIGGLDDAKREMIEAVEMPITHKAIFERYNKKPIKGVLLYGPPGCGKTMLGKAASTAISKIHGHTNTPGFFYVKGPEVLSKWVGETEATIRTLFDKAREFKKAHGTPAVIFIDEAESLLHHRNQESSGIGMTVVPAFLAEMDGLDDSGAMVLLSTNRPDTLDSAIVRDGRIDRKIHVPRPSKNETAEIFKKYLKKIPTSDRDLSEALAAEVFHERFAFYEVALRSGGTRKFGLQHIVSGAMVANIVENAISLAMHREIESRSAGGVARNDLFEAVSKTFRQNKDLSHENDVKTFVEPFRSDVESIKRCVN